MTCQFICLQQIKGKDRTPCEKYIASSFPTIAASCWRETRHGFGNGVQWKTRVSVCFPWCFQSWFLPKSCLNPRPQDSRQTNKLFSGFCFRLCSTLTYLNILIFSTPGGFKQAFLNRSVYPLIGEHEVPGPST